MKRAFGRERAALGRLISLIESDSAHLDTLIPALYARPPQATVIGVTGPPGAGKSTFVGALLQRLLAERRRVAVIAVDPTSPITRGAVLGDRVRMTRAVSPTGLFIRSVAARGQLGGISGRTGLIVDLMDAAGYDTVIIETVGVGQSEIAIAALAQVTVLLLAPGLGDDVQSLKAGILEVADLFVVNKSDVAGADVLADHLHAMPPAPGRLHLVEVVKCSATRGDGMAEVIAALQCLTRSHTSLRDARADRLSVMLREIAIAQFSDRIDAASTEVRELAAQVATGALTLDTGVGLLLKGVSFEPE